MNIDKYYPPVSLPGGKTGYRFPLAHITGRRITDPTNVWFDFGDVKNFVVGWTVDKKTVYRSNAGRRVIGDQRTVQLDGNVTFEPYQYIPFFKALQMMSLPVPLVQAAGSGTISAKVGVGRIIAIENFYDISDITSEDWIEDTHFILRDEDASEFEIIALPAGVDEDDVVVFGFDYAEITAAQKRYKGTIGSVSSVPIQIRVRQITDNEDHALYQINYVDAATEGDAVLVGSDGEFTGMKFSGGAQDRGAGIGKWVDLKAQP